jgi:hypothetical protein
MLFSIGLLLVVVYIAWRVAPREKEEDALVHGAGQIGLLAAVALFGVDYFTSYFYASGELMGALHPYGLDHLGYYAVAAIAFANIVFGALYMYSLGVFSEGGGSFTAAMRYLGPSLSLIVAVVLIQDYVLTIVVSTLSGVDQLLSITNSYGIHWFWHFALGAALAMTTWYVTIRGRGESAQMVGTLLGIFLMLTVAMAIGLFVALSRQVPPVPAEALQQTSTLGEALRHLLTASMKGMVALSGLEAMSNGIQFVKGEDAAIVAWAKRHLPRLRRLWGFYSGKVGIGRVVQTAFLFYGGLTTLLLVAFAIRFNVYDGTLGRTLVGNLAFIGFGQMPGGVVLYWAYQILAVAMLAAASMTAYQGLQSMIWRNVAIGEIPEAVVYRNPKGTFTRPVTAAVIAAILIQFAVQGRTTVAVPYYGVGVFLPLSAMALAIRKHFEQQPASRNRTYGLALSTGATVLGVLVFVGQIVGKWEEGGWAVLISLSVLILMAHAILISPVGYRDAEQLKRIIYKKSGADDTTGAIVEWQSRQAQAYRLRLLARATILIAKFWELFGVHRPVRFEPPGVAGAHEEVVDGDFSHGRSDLDPTIESASQTPEPGAPSPDGTKGPDQPPVA